MNDFADLVELMLKEMGIDGRPKPLGEEYYKSSEETNATQTDLNFYLARNAAAENRVSMMAWASTESGVYSSSYTSEEVNEEIDSPKRLIKK